jgi:hypothetical protein
MKMNFFEEAYKCFAYGAELEPLAADCFLRRSQCVMYNLESSVAELKEAVKDANYALERRPRDKFFQKHKAELEVAI